MDEFDGHVSRARPGVYSGRMVEAIPAESGYRANGAIVKIRTVSPPLGERDVPGETEKDPKNGQKPEAAGTFEGFSLPHPGKPAHEGLNH